MIKFEVSGRGNFRITNNSLDYRSSLNFFPVTLNYGDGLEGG